ncbi:MAG: YceD family protein [Candidatus Bipolaricaulia bacterium]
MALNLKKLREVPGRVLPVAEVYAALPVAPEQAFVLRGNVSVQGRAVQRDRTVLLDLRIQATAVQQCSRCLSDVISSLDWEEHLEFQPEESESLWEREVFTYSLQDTELSLQPYIVGLISGVLDPKPLCRPDCKGLCPVCGQDLNIRDCGCVVRREGDPRLKVLKELLR